MSAKRVSPQIIAVRQRELQREWGMQLIDLGALLADMGQAMVDDDEIAGIISGGGLIDHLASLPKHIRDLFAEHLTDEAARGLWSDRAYIEQQRDRSA